MAVSLRASQRGLEIVDHARRRKGWTKMANAWYQEALVGKAALRKFWQRKPITQDNFIRICEAVGLKNWQDIVEGDPIQTTDLPVASVPDSSLCSERSCFQHEEASVLGTGNTNATPRQDWGEAPDIPYFVGRTKELDQLKQWMIKERCRLVALLGMGGIGKTALSVKLAQQIQGEFEYIIWRSLRNAPPFPEIVTDTIKFLSNQQETDLPETTNGKLSRLIHYLRSSRCLLIFDNADTIFRSGECAGDYREGYEQYGELFRRVGETPNQSCLLLTSREKPQEVAFFEGRQEGKHIQSLKLEGLEKSNVQELFQSRGTFSGSESEWNELLTLYA